AYGVAFQVNTQAKELSQSLLKAVSPQIMQSEGKENRHRMINLSIMTNKLGFMLVGIIFIPLSLSIDYIISLWLKVVPE
ncbi:hypothetical protein, partial [Vibrio sp. 10N.222.49.C9]|uniref:hypothetical protein n=1 Tax=Vibrio sp. 10N.222.49.C9 TaxID=3229615 RepID=UPI00354D0C5E